MVQTETFSGYKKWDQMEIFAEELLIATITKEKELKGDHIMQMES